MNADKLLNEAMKREARKAISDYIKKEMHSLAYEEAAIIVAQWMKDHRKILEGEVDTLMAKKIKAVTRQGVEHAINSLRW